MRYVLIQPATLHVFVFDLSLSFRVRARLCVRAHHGCDGSCRRTLGGMGGARAHTKMSFCKSLLYSHWLRNAGELDRHTRSIYPTMYQPSFFRETQKR